MSKGQRFAVIIGLHQRRLSEARRGIGRLEQAFAQCADKINELSTTQQQSAMGVNYLLYDQYLSYCSHLQAKINDFQNQQAKVEQAIVLAWDAFREIRRELQVFEKLQERQDHQAQRQQQRREQRSLVDDAVRNWLEATA